SSSHINMEEEIVISGISGRYPECNNIKELKEALLKGVDLITDDETRFPREYLRVMNIPSRMGKMPELDKFDASFFGINPKQAEFMDPRYRILCETVYEAMVDAGVYVGSPIFPHPERMRQREDTQGYMFLGINLSMASNRISYCFDLKGKSYSMDSACSSSLYAFVNAVEDIKNGIVDAAIVSGVQAMFHPQDSSEAVVLNMLAPDGKCKVYSKLRDGFVRSEAVVSLLLQKKNQCRRLYASVIGGLTNTDGYKVEGITYPSSEMQLSLMQQLYAKHGINPDDILYVEGHGTGTPVGDVQELAAINEMFCKNRKTPLFLGSVKSNIGHTEIAASFCSISKLIIAMETGVIPANLHVDPIDTTLPGIKEGKIKVVDKNLPFDGGMVAVNSFGFGGANAHVVLKPNPKPKRESNERPKHRLVQVSGRTEEAVNHLLDEIEKNCDDEEFLALVDEIHKMNIDGHYFRGYVVLGQSPKREISKYSKRRPIWFIYTGMGCQWLNMGRDLMGNDVFRNTIKRCADALMPYGINLEEILTNPKSDTFDDPNNCFTAITSVQIALTDLLWSLDIRPEGFAGHSLGEVGCSYADGNLTPEDAIRLAYGRGYASTCVKMPAGIMAAVGLSKEECLKLLPDDIFIACDNGKTSVTIAGLEDPTLKLVEKLTSKGIFIKKVNSLGFAYHTKYVKDSVPYLHQILEEVLKTPTLRSSKWISTSLADHQRNKHWARYNCAEYHRNNYANPVNFRQLYKHVPEDAIVVEVAPHGLLQSILRKELPSTTTILSLADRNCQDNEERFLSAIGKIYLAGGQPNLKNLYKGVTYPVSRGTKMISPLVKWDHRISWFVPMWKPVDSFGHVTTVNISNERYSYLSGHNVDGTVVMPASGYLELAWRTLARLYLKPIEKLPVVIEDVQFIRTTSLPSKTDIQFSVNIMKQSGYFEISEGGSVVCTGKIYSKPDISCEYSNASFSKASTEELVLAAEDFYKECHLRGYYLEDCFQCLQKCDVHILHGKLKWKGNFSCFLNSMLVMPIVSEVERDYLLLPSAVDKIVIDPVDHLMRASENSDFFISLNKTANTIKSGGIEIRGLVFSKALRRKPAEKTRRLETYDFVAYEMSMDSNFDLVKCLRVVAQIIVENNKCSTSSFKVCYMKKNDPNELMAKIKSTLEEQIMVETEYLNYSKVDSQSNTFDLVVITEDLIAIDAGEIIKCLHNKGMILYLGDITKITVDNMDVIYKATSHRCDLYLLRPKLKSHLKFSVVPINSSNSNCLQEIKNIPVAQSDEVVLLVSHEEDASSLIELMKASTELSSLNCRFVFIEDTNADKFSVEASFYRHQLEKNIIFNILKNGKWGTIVQLPLNVKQEKEVENASVNVSSVGDLSSLLNLFHSSNSVSEHVYVFYSALDVRDGMVANVKLNQTLNHRTVCGINNIGLEYAGITNSGRRVMGLVEHGSLSLQVQNDPELTWDVPSRWSLEEAATIPSAYTVSYYAMLVRGGLQCGKSVLIYKGTSSLGIAAIRIASSMRCTVLTTVENDEDKFYLKEICPQLKVANILCISRNAEFVSMVMEKTNGKGVDLVLNTLSGELLKELLKCVKSKGKFINIGHQEPASYTSAELKLFLENCSVTVDELFQCNSNVKEQITKILAEGIKSGVIQPLPRTILKDNQVEEAFRLLSSEKHKDKVLIELRKDDPETVESPLRTIKATPKVYFCPEKSYIVINGLQGFGTELVDWLIKRGVTKLVVTSNERILTGFQTYCFQRWTKCNVTVEINDDDISTKEGVGKLIASAKQLGPVGGIFDLSLLLKSIWVENQTNEIYEALVNSKIMSACYIDEVTREYCPDLDHFVVFSSFVHLRLFEYEVASCALEKLCKKRRRENFPALLTRWGPIADVGSRNEVSGEKMLAQDGSSCLEALEKFMLQDSVVVSSVVLADEHCESSAVKRRRTAADAVAVILGICDIGIIEEMSTLSQMGLDSLMAAQVKQLLFRNYNLDLNTDEIWNLTFKQLNELSDSTEGKPTLVQKGEERLLYQTVTPILCDEPIIKMHQAETGTRTVFLIHHIQGDVAILDTLASQLNALVYGLQCTKEMDFVSIQEYASYFLKQVKAKQPQGPYFFCGYSFGAVIALELCYSLERHGETVQIVCLDGSPAFATTGLRNHFVKEDKSVDRTAILIYFVSAFTNVDKDKIVKELESTTRWEEQLQIVGDLISAETGLDAELVTVSADRYYKRCLAGLHYQSKISSLNARVLLVKASETFLSSEDYDLQQICKQKVEVMELNGDHQTVVRGENARIISDKINSFRLKS
ncbi:hypothetical protein NQ315_016025, partial [Exocentrus adspersus]